MKIGKKTCLSIFLVILVALVFIGCGSDTSSSSDYGNTEPKKPEEGKEIKVTLTVETVISDSKKLQVKGKTNLPDETELMLSLENSSVNYLAQDKVIVQNGMFSSSWFGDASRPGESLANGTYLLKVSTPTVSVLSPSVKDILGENGRNMTGNLVKFDEVFGNQVEFYKEIKIQ